MKRSYRKVNIEISNICNIQCSFCPEVIRPKKLMELSLFQRIIEEVAPLTKLVAFHLMGEPLIHPQLDEFVEIAHSHKLKIFFVTNGILLRPKMYDLLLHPAFRQISFSLHSFSDYFPDKDPTSYLENIFSFTQRAMAERPGLFINYRLWNLQDGIGGRNGSKNLDFLERIESRFSVSVPRNINTNAKKSYLIKRPLSLHFDTEFTWPMMDLPVIGVQGTCHGLSSHFGVLSDGSVVPCCLDKEGDLTLGRIPEQSLSEILSSPRARKILHGFKNNDLVEDLCQRCQYIERFQVTQSDNIPLAQPVQ